MYAAAAAAKSLQSCPTLWDPTDGSPPGSPVPGILQARTLEWAAISFSNAWKCKVKVKSLSRVQLLAIPWAAVYQAPPSKGFSGQEFWSGLSLPSPDSIYRISHSCIQTLVFSQFTKKKGGKIELLWNKNSFGHWITMYHMSSCNTLNSDSYDLSSFPKNEYLHLFLTRSFILNIHKMLWALHERNDVNTRYYY